MLVGIVVLMGCLGPLDLRLQRDWPLYNLDVTARQNQPIRGNST